MEAFHIGADASPQTNNPIITTSLHYDRNMRYLPSILQDKNESNFRKIVLFVLTWIDSVSHSHMLSI